MVQNLSVTSYLSNLQSAVEEIRTQFDVPALSVAILFDNEIYRAVSGVLNINTGVKATTDSIFQIASISKVFTASLVMLLVDEGKLDLDAPLKHYLPDFTLANAMAAEEITVLQLLNHTSGIPGDFIGNNSYTEQGAIERYVDRCSGLHLVHCPGDKYSYSNAAYNVAGRLIEVALNTTWFDAVERKIFEPLGMQQAVAHPSQVVKHRVAVGHIPDIETENSWVLPSDVYFPIGWAPAGSVLTVSASDLIVFAKAHLKLGKTMTGAKWLSRQSTERMQAAQINLPDYSPWSSTHCGIGWHLRQGNHPMLIGHSGVGPGQRSMLQMVPDYNFAIAAMHNSSNAALLPALLEDVINKLTGIQLKPCNPNNRTYQAISLECLLGVYESILSRIVVSITNKQLVINLTPRLDHPTDTEIHCLKRIDKYSFVYQSQDEEVSLSFIDIDSVGKANYIFYRGRLMPKKLITEKCFADQKI